MTDRRPTFCRRLLPLSALALIGCAVAGELDAAPPTPVAAPAVPKIAEAALGLAPHRAVYTLGLKTARGSAGVVAADGAMSYRLDETCEAWTVETNIVLRLSYADSGDVTIQWAFAGVEDKDGLGYRFRMRHTRDGETVEALKGEARLDGPGAGGEARFDDPSGETIGLPKGTLFPTRHLAQLIAAAEAGKRFFPKAVFDGASLDNPYQVSATITAPRQPTPKNAAKDAAGKTRTVDGRAATDALIAAAGLDRTTVWPVRLAFFPNGSRAPEPEFELGIDYRSDGVAERIEQDYGDFVIDMRPGTIEALPKPKC